MFKTHKQEESPRFATVIDKDTKVSGNIEFTRSVLVNGVVNGSIEDIGDLEESHICIGEDGFVEGNISASHATIEGRLEGNITGRISVNMEKGCHIKGDCTYSELQMKPGSYFEGNFKPNKETPPLLKADKAKHTK